MKWGLGGPARVGDAGRDPRTPEIGTLALREWQNLPRPMRVVGVNVRRRGRAGARRGATRALAPASRVAAGDGGRRRRDQSLRQAGATGRRPLAALVAVRRRVLATGLFPPPAVVVNAAAPR